MRDNKNIITFLGAYYLITALWPIFHMQSFEKITGPKRDHWLVKTVSVMILASAVIFLNASLLRGQISFEVKLLATLNALGLTLIDLIYVTKRRIHPVYLCDALVELPLAAALWV